MTPKEKAQSLVWNKLEMVTDDSCVNSYEGVRTNEQNTERLRKEVALVLVHEMLEVINHDNELFKYWYYVREEIKLL